MEKEIIKDGITYKLFASDEYGVVKYHSSEKEVIIPEEINGLPITHIAERAFYQSCIRSVKLPDTIRTIGTEVFMNCSELKSINFPNSLSSIGNYAFYNTGLTEICFQENLSFFGEYSFSECSELKSIIFKQNVKMSFFQYAFSGCYNLSTVYVNSIKNWCNSIFYNVYANPLSNDNVWLYENGSAVISIQGNVNNLCFVKCRTHKMILDSVKAKKDSFLNLKVDFLVIPNPVEIKLTDFSEPAFASIRELEIINENNEYDTYVLPECSNEIVESLIKW